MMYHVKKYVIAIGVMLVTSVVTLLFVSTLTYLFKWQADKAMIGIIVTYVFVGFVGGFGTRWIERRWYRNDVSPGMRENAIEALGVSSMFMVVLVVVSILWLQNTFVLSGRFLMIWGLVGSSIFLGRWIGRG